MRGPEFSPKHRMSLPKHRYTRQFDTASADSLAQLSEWVPAGSAVLELGPAEGYFTRHLHETRQCAIDAVEIDREMAEKARPWCRRLIVGDLERMALAETFPAHAYDAIILADVLEHLRFPERILPQLAGLLKPGGACLISVPNIAYGGLIAELLEGRFDYRSEGLLDRTHLRFFTRDSLAALFDGTGWHAREWRPVMLPFFESEFRTRLETLPAAVATLLDSRPALHCYQWLAKITPEAQDGPEVPAALPAKPFSEHFPVRLFWADGDAPFDYSRSQVVWGKVGAERQTVRFTLPAEGRGRRLRLRLADRPGFVRLYSIGVRGEDGAVLWRWASGFGGAALGGAMAEMDCTGAGAYALAALRGAESWLDLPSAKDGNAVPGSVLVELGWPMSPDFLIARQGWERALIPLQMETNAVKALVGTRDLELAARDAALAERERLIVAGDAALAERDDIIAARDAVLAEKERAIAAGDTALAECARVIAAQDIALAERGNLIAGKDAALAGKDNTLNSLNAVLATQREALESQRETAAAQSAQIAALNSEIARMRSFSWWLRRALHWPGRALQRPRKP